MSVFDIFKKHTPAQENREPETSNNSIYSGMRVEVTKLNGDLLFVAKLINLKRDSAELRQFSETSIPQNPDQEPMQVRIRGYHDRERKAVHMEGTIFPLPDENIWQVENLIITDTNNDRAFFRLDTNQDATATTFQGLNPGEHPCRLLNISVGGALIRSETPYQPGDKFLLKVKLLEDREPSAMYCEVLRIIHKEEGPDEYGCHFLELNEADQDRITENIFAVQRQKRSSRGSWDI